VALLGGWLAISLGGLFEGAVFGGDYRSWLLRVLGLTYDQRNSLVVGFAMGFAVIPIIFTIAEDSLSNVPQHLRAGSLALGATPWQTAIRVILPTASPGIFSAIMIGFGRAVGETMIVLMATGNTPVMDWSIFNGFRALSANIAVELPEAPEGGTLYRVLFLAAFLLFVMTFVVNTVAELVRLRLRRKYRYL
jgi:phosphate transport system permease protein